MMAIWNVPKENESKYLSELKKTGRLSGLIVGIFLLFSPYQNCSNNVSFDNQDLSSSGDASGVDTGTGVPVGSLLINKGASYATSLGVDLAIGALNARAMALQNEVCPEKAAEWLPIESEKKWSLNDHDGESKVYLRLRAEDGSLSKCIEARIFVDRKAPELTVRSGPSSISSARDAELELGIVEEGSGIEQIFCKKPSQLDYAPCSSFVELNDLSEGSLTFSAYVSDRAGNKSDLFKYSWSSDFTAPTVKFLDPLPPAISVISELTFQFEGDDGTGSGVASYQCLFDGVSLSSCQSPLPLIGLSDGTHTLVVRAVDKAGLKSLPMSQTFQVDTKPSGAFQVLGVTGGSDNIVDPFLANTSLAVIHWSASKEAQSYQVTINDQNGASVCGSSAMDPSTLQAIISNCGFVEGAKYLVKASSFKNGLETKAPEFSFQVDTLAPKIEITKLSTTSSNVTVDYKISEGGSGLAGATCRLVNGPSKDCVLQTTVSFDNLGVGSYEFLMSAVDFAGNQALPVSQKFDIVPAARLGKDSFTATPVVSSDPNVDLIWVVDNSGSMNAEATHVRSNLLNFANYVSAKSSLKLAVISQQGTTGTSVSVPTNDSRFLQINQYISSYSGPRITREILLASPSPNGTLREQQAYKLNNFLRPLVQKAFVFVTDDESTELTATDFLLTLESKFPGQKPFVNGFVGFENRTLSPCMAAHGKQYFTLANNTGGDLFNICATDWTTSFDKLAKTIINSSVENRFTLSQTVVTKIISVTLNGVAINSADYSLSGNILTITKSLLEIGKPVAIEVQYNY